MVKKESQGIIENLKAVITEVQEDICENYCKYRDTCDENLECDAIRNTGSCPLDRLM